MSRTRSRIDTDWFKSRLSATNKSMRMLAEHLDMNVSQVSRTLHGERIMQMTEAQAIAHFLGTHVTEVLRHAGMEENDGDGRIMLAATVNEKGHVEGILEPKQLPRSVVDRATAAIEIHGNSKVIAAQVRALSGPLAIFDDAVLLFGHTDTVEHDAIGALSICRNRKGEQILAKIERARKTGEATLRCVDSDTREFTLHTATPILAIIP